MTWARQFLRHPKMRRKYGTKRREKQRELLKKRWIDERPQIINDRVNYGHWEGDTVTGKNQSGYLVTLVERKNGYAIVGHIPNKTGVEQAELDLAVKLLNTRPRKRHCYKSPDALLKPYLDIAV